MFPSRLLVIHGITAFLLQEHAHPSTFVQDRQDYGDLRVCVNVLGPDDLIGESRPKIACIQLAAKPGGNGNSLQNLDARPSPASQTNRTGEELVNRHVRIGDE
jgi:hypothetical protein